MNEIWKPIPKFPNYEISSLGNVKRDGEVLKNKCKSRYKSIVLKSKNKSKIFFIHRIVAEAFCKKLPGRTEVDHINGDSHDNRAENLEWVSHQENLRRAGKTKKRFRSLSELPKFMNDNPLLKVKEVSKFLGVSETAVKKYIGTGELIASRFGKNLRIELDNLKQFVLNY